LLGEVEKWIKDEESRKTLQKAFLFMILES